jgi:hypothetical protein
MCYLDIFSRMSSSLQPQKKKMTSHVTTSAKATVSLNTIVKYAQRMNYWWPSLQAEIDQGNQHRISQSSLSSSSLLLAQTSVLTPEMKQQVPAAAVAVAITDCVQLTTSREDNINNNNNAMVPTTNQQPTTPTASMTEMERTSLPVMIMPLRPLNTELIQEASQKMNEISNFQDNTPLGRRANTPSPSPSVIHHHHHHHHNNNNGNHRPRAGSSSRIRHSHLHFPQQRRFPSHPKNYRPVTASASFSSSSSSSLPSSPLSARQNHQQQQQHQRRPSQQQQGEDQQQQTNMVQCSCGQRHIFAAHKNHAETNSAVDPSQYANENFAFPQFDSNYHYAWGSPVIPGYYYYPLNGNSPMVPSLPSSSSTPSLYYPPHMHDATHQPQSETGVFSRVRSASASLVTTPTALDSTDQNVSPSSSSSSTPIHRSSLSPSPPPPMMMVMVPTTTSKASEALIHGMPMDHHHHHLPPESMLDVSHATTTTIVTEVPAAAAMATAQVTDMQSHDHQQQQDTKSTDTPVSAVNLLENNSDHASSTLVSSSSSSPSIDNQKESTQPGCGSCPCCQLWQNKYLSMQSTL